VTLSNLPSQSTLFIGRKDELTKIEHLLANPTCRLLTLVGPGGIGKTRLALEAAGLQADASENGVYFIALQPLTSPDFIVPTIADALNMTLYGQGDPKTQLLHYLSEKRLLLLLDNFEYLLDGADLLSEILAHAPDVKILVTSRERLHLREEWLFEVGGLSFPQKGHDTAADDYSAVRLFMQSASRAGYTPTESDMPSIAHICRLVGGMPLALELAAAWVRAVPCSEIAREIENSLDILTATTRNMPEAHRSMRAAFERSWNLLTDMERAVFSKLSVFRGGCTREGAEKVAGATLPILASLVDKSLLQVNASGRYDLHELLRQYAADKLLDANEEHIAIQRHNDFFLRLAEGAEAHSFGREQIAWFDHLQAEMDNIRAALMRSLEDELGLRLAASLGWFFNERTYWQEGLDWLDRTLQANPDAPVPLRAKALTFAGALVYQPGGVPGAGTYLEKALALARATGDHSSIAWALSWLALLEGGTDLALAASHLDESLALFRERQDFMGVTHTLIRRSWIARGQGDGDYERLLLEEAGNLAREAEDAICSGWVFLGLGHLSLRQHNDLAQARIHYENSLSFFRQAHFPNGYIRSMIFLAEVEQSIGNSARAQTLRDELWLAMREIEPDGPFLRLSLSLLAYQANRQGQFERTAILFGAVGSLILVRDVIQATAVGLIDESVVTDLKAQLGEAAFAQAWAVGNAMTREQAIAYAVEARNTLQDLSSGAKTVSASPLLTEREIEILQLSADGLNSREIADRLVLSVGTIRWYLKQIYSKLDAHSRSQAIANARSLGLLS
jgi:predicted ATPase/DNA-binding NarL/FixJ family response regulator